MRPTAETLGYIYAIGRADGQGPIKIGWTTGLVGRLRSLQGASPYDLVILGCRRGTLEVERRFHDSLAELRLKGEWFDVPFSPLAHDLPEAPRELVEEGLALDHAAL